MTENRATKILRILIENFNIPQWAGSRRDAFQTLIRTVISQATTSRNTTRAFDNLSRRFPIAPQALAEAEEREVEQAIRVAGLHRNKSRAIKALSRIVVKKLNGSLDFIKSLELEEARRILMNLPGVGPKTADIVLLFSARKPTIPVDTHVKRVSKRLGLAPLEADYEGVRKALQSLYSPRNYLSVHLLLISLGQRYCKARTPLCEVCPVNALCPSKHQRIRRRDRL